MQLIRKQRLRLARRLRTLKLMGDSRTKHDPDDHPIIEILIEMSNTYHNDPRTPAERDNCLSNMHDVCQSILDGSVDSHRQNVEDMKHAMKFNFAQKVHEDRMDLAREAYNGKKGGAISKLMKIAGDNHIPDLARSLPAKAASLEREATIDERNEDRQELQAEFAPFFDNKIKTRNPLGPLDLSTDSDEDSVPISDTP